MVRFSPLTEPLSKESGDVISWSTPNKLPPPRAYPAVEPLSSRRPLWLRQNWVLTAFGQLLQRRLNCSLCLLREIGVRSYGGGIKNICVLLTKIYWILSSVFMAFHNFSRVSLTDMTTTSLVVFEMLPPQTTVFLSVEPFGGPLMGSPNKTSETYSLMHID